MTDSSPSDRFNLQDGKYDFPYHYLPVFSAADTPQVYAYLDWGLQYLTYMTYIRDLTLSYQPRSVLDVGCGDGRMLSMLGASIPTRVGVDPSSRAIALATALVPGADFHISTAEEVDGEFDLVTCVETLEHIADHEIEGFVESLNSRTRKDGRLIVSVPSVVLPQSAKHYRHYTIEVLKRQLSPHFQLLEAYFLVKDGFANSLLTGMLSNRWVIVTSATWRRFVWKLYKRHCVFSPEARGQHIVAEFRRIE